MALIDDVKEEIKKAHTTKVHEHKDEKPEKKGRQKTKEEIAAYIARKQAEEERRYLKQQDVKEAEASKKARKPKVEKVANEAAQDDPKPEKPKRRRKNVMSESYATKSRPKTVRTIDLPDGGSLLIVYIPGPA